MFVWDVLGRRTEGGELAVVGGVKAPDSDMALLLARETHFRHKEGVEYAVRRRGEKEIHPGAYRGDALGGITDRSYRRQQAYAGVGAKLKRVAERMVFLPDVGVVELAQPVCVVEGNEHIAVADR